MTKENNRLKQFIESLKSESEDLRWIFWEETLEKFNTLISENPDEIYKKCIENWFFDVAYRLCIFMIEEEVYYETRRIIEIWNEWWYNLRSLLPTFYNINTEVSRKWKNRIEEVEDLFYEKLIKNWDLEKAFKLCETWLDREVLKEKSRRKENWIIDIMWLYQNKDTIDNERAKEWKERIEDIKTMIYENLINKEEFEKAIKFCITMLDEVYRKKISRISSYWLYELNQNWLNLDKDLEIEEERWSELQKETFIKQINYLIEIWDLERAKEVTINTLNDNIFKSIHSYLKEILKKINDCIYDKLIKENNFWWAMDFCVKVIQESDKNDEWEMGKWSERLDVFRKKK